MRTSRRVRAVLLGTTDASLRSVLADVLGEVGVEVGGDSTPDLVLAVVDRDDVKEVVAGARERGGGCPIIAILTLTDDRLEARAIAAGAHACCALDRPLDRLKSALTRLPGVGS